MSTITGSPSGYVNRMVELESKRHGDQVNAVDRVAGILGIGSRAVRRIMNGERKTFRLGFPEFIAAKYLEVCESQLRKLETEIRIVRAIHGDLHDLENIEDEAAALRGRVERAKEKAK